MEIVLIVVVILAAYLYKKRKERRAEIELEHEKWLQQRNNTAKSITGQDPISAIVQILESTSIMATSKNIDTIEGRAEYLKKRFETIKWASLKGNYQRVVQRGIDRYKTTYYDSDIYDWQVKIITAPHSFNFSLFYAKCIYEGFLRHYDHQLEEIESLKMDYAINNRYEKLKSKLNEVWSILSEITGSSDAIRFFQSIKPELKNLKKEINQHISHPS